MTDLISLSIAEALASAGISARTVGRIGQNRPNVIDIIEEGMLAHGQRDR